MGTRGLFSCILDWRASLPSARPAPNSLTHGVVLAFFFSVSWLGPVVNERKYFFKNNVCWDQSSTFRDDNDGQTTVLLYMSIIYTY